MEIKEYEITVKVKLYAGHEDSAKNIRGELTVLTGNLLAEKKNVIIPMDAIYTNVEEVKND